MLLLMEADKERTFSPSPDNAGTETPAIGRQLPQLEIGMMMSTERNLTGDGDGDGSSAVADAEGGGSGGALETVVRRKRGRPRKYHDVNETTVFSVSPVEFSTPSFAVSPKRGRGRPRGSGKLQLLASLGGYAAETAGAGFTPHVVHVHTGEDIVKKILSFSQKGPRSVCILSANGVVSSVIIRQPGSSGGTLRYEGRFEILSLSGSFAFGETSAARRKNSMLTVSLAKPDGRVFGGAVAGSVLAAGPIQLVVGSFKQKTKKGPQNRHSAESSMAVVRPGPSDVSRVPVPIARMTNGDENHLTPISTLSELNHGGANSISINDQSLNPASLHSIAWNTLQLTEPMPDQRTSPEINASVPQI